MVYGCNHGGAYASCWRCRTKLSIPKEITILGTPYKDTYLKEQKWVFDGSVEKNNVRVYCPSCHMERKSKDWERLIRVEYTGFYPNVCSGHLIIKIQGKEVFRSDDLSFRSTGSCGSADGSVVRGNLVWRNGYTEKYFAFLETLDKYQILAVQKLVKQTLGRVNVCCGGCL